MIHWRVVPATTDLVRAVDAETWAAGLSLRVRAAVHVAEVDLRDADYYGVGVNQAARLLALAHGGQLLVTRAVADIAGHLLAGGLELRSLGSHRVRDFPRREEVFQVKGPGQEVEFPATQRRGHVGAAARCERPHRYRGSIGSRGSPHARRIGRSADAVAAQSPSLVRLTAWPLPQAVGRRLSRCI